MNKKKNWQFFIILIVFALTAYNILPTIFYYCKPLKSPIEQPQAEKIAKSVFQRVNSLESESLSWINAFCEHLQVKPKKIQLSSNPQQIQVSFNNIEDANKFKKFFPRAGTLKPFSPSRLTLLNTAKEPKTVNIQRLVSTHFNLDNIDQYYKFGKKFDKEGNITKFYKNLIFERASQILFAIAGQNDRSLILSQILESQPNESNSDQIYKLANLVVRFDLAFKNNSLDFA